jgi:hypothetical protein
MPSRHRQQNIIAHNDRTNQPPQRRNHISFLIIIEGSSSICRDLTGGSQVGAWIRTHRSAGRAVTWAINAKVQTKTIFFTRKNVFEVFFCLFKIKV